MATQQNSAPIPHTSGIYLIRCRPTGKIYVGSAVDLRRRWSIHQRALRKRAHHNEHLQAAWNLFGEVEFEFEILELVTRSRLLIAEQKWIDQTRCADRSIGFNVNSLASTQNEKTPYTWDGFRNPAGDAVKRGKRPSHKGWTWRNHDANEIAKWRRPSQVHESPDLRDEPVPATARAQSC